MATRTTTTASGTKAYSCDGLVHLTWANLLSLNRTLKWETRIVDYRWTHKSHSESEWKRGYVALEPKSLTYCSVRLSYFT